MIKVNIAALKSKLSEYLERVERGEHVLICRRNEPVAELRPLAVPRKLERPIGRAKGQLTVPDSFFEPLPKDVVGAFYSEGSSGSTRVAEPTARALRSGRARRRRPRR